jgi:hypothetical protein
LAELSSVALLATLDARRDLQGMQECRSEKNLSPFPATKVNAQARGRTRVDADGDVVTADG